RAARAQGRGNTLPARSGMRRAAPPLRRIFPEMAQSVGIQERLNHARAAALEAGKLILQHHQSPRLTAARKRDSSPVTIADRKAEEFLRAWIGREFPRDGILGEEFGEQPGTSGFRWILDPLDGTKSFIHGVPLFGTLVGLESHGTCV